MRADKIELFVNRLNGLYPGKSFAKNTAVNAWRNDPFMLSVDEGLGRRALEILERDEDFPTLYRVKSVFRQLMTEDKERQAKACPDCHGEGFVGIEMIEAIPDKFPGKLFPCAIPCKCRSNELPKV